MLCAAGGLDETLHNIIDCACEQNIPFVFALNRKALGRCVNKAVPVSVVGIFSYDGAQVSWNKSLHVFFFKKLHFLLGRGDENTVIFKGLFVCFAFADLHSSSQVIHIAYMKNWF